MLRQRTTRFEVVRLLCSHAYRPTRLFQLINNDTVSRQTGEVIES